jgi:hypothetical protein
VSCVVSVMGDGAFAGSVGGEVRPWETPRMVGVIAVGAWGVVDADAIVDAGGDSVTSVGADSA